MAAASMQLINLQVSFYTLLILQSISSSAQCDFPAIINLGDSNSDTGGLSATFVPIKSPYGETFFKFPAGRFYDGRLIIDFIAESFGLPYISAYLDSLGTNFSHGANFATSASTILPQNLSLSVGGYSPFSLDIQLEQLLQFKSRSQLIISMKGGMFKQLMRMDEYFSRALYTIDIGQNDLTQGLDANKSIQDFVPDALYQFSNVVKRIYEMGGRSFWIHNTGPLGCLPYVFLRTTLANDQKDSAGCGIMYNEFALQFNKLLNETVVKLREELPLSSITYVDVYSAKYSLISHAAEHGFERLLTTCCGYGGGEFNFNYNVRCGNTATVNGREVLLGKSCPEPEKNIIWDGVHYTEAANKWVFDRISTGGHYNVSVVTYIQVRDRIRLDTISLAS